MWERINKIRLSKRTTIALGVVLFLVVGIVITIVALQKQQNIKQRAAETPLACAVTQAKCSWGTVANISAYHVKVINMSTGSVEKDQNVTTNVHDIAWNATAGVTYRCEVKGVSNCGPAEGPAGIGVNICPADNSPTPTITATPSPTVTLTLTPTGTLTPTPTGTLTPTPTNTPSPTPTVTPTPTPTVTPSATPTGTPQPTPTPKVIVVVPATNTPAPVVITATPQPTLAPTGPGDNITIAGSAAFGVLLIGAVLFFIL